MDKSYLPNLNGLRFFAAATVILYHVDLALVMNGYKPYPIMHFPFAFGDLAVVLFFVLSGFLITWLLLAEKEKKDISLSRFYLKRILRIWPLYYAIVIGSFLLFNHLDFLKWNGVTTNISDHHHFIVYTLLLFICPNVSLLFTHSLGYATQTWSIGIEEQFYLVWPLLIKSKRAVFFIAGIIIIMLFLGNGVLQHLPVKNQITDKLNQFFSSAYGFKIDSMAIGAMGAYISRYRSNYLKIIFSKASQVILYILLLPLLWIPHIVNYQIYSVFFIIIILNLALNPNTIIKFENPVLNYLGKISYGIYIFHTIAIVPAIAITTAFFKVNLATEMFIFLVGILITILIASLSYKYFESYFLRMKDNGKREKFM